MVVMIGNLLMIPPQLGAFRMLLCMISAEENCYAFGVRTRSNAFRKTPWDGVDENEPALLWTRSWRSSSHVKEKTRSSAYDAAGNLKLSVHGRMEAQRDCGICEEVAVGPGTHRRRAFSLPYISTLPSTRSTHATVAVHGPHSINVVVCCFLPPNLAPAQWTYGPAAAGLCPAYATLCVLPPAPDATSPAHAALLSLSVRRASSRFAVRRRTPTHMQRLPRRAHPRFRGAEAVRGARLAERAIKILLGDHCISEFEDERRPLKQGKSRMLPDQEAVDSLSHKIGGGGCQKFEKTNERLGRNSLMTSKNMPVDREDQEKHIHVPVCQRGNKKMEAKMSVGKSTDFSLEHRTARTLQDEIVEEE
ncbi:hypothetical protein C8R44DRAFT_725712 [Mycena epipterygia]|nr:hypothetical protein C8R44DRAFT_725712 [Mycena epipterygia]